MRIEASVHHVAETNRTLTLVKQGANAVYCTVHQLSEDRTTLLDGDGTIVIGSQAFEAQIMAVCYRLYGDGKGVMGFNAEQLTEVLSLFMGYKD